jgi:hypothetical protein
MNNDVPVSKNTSKLLHSEEKYLRYIENLLTKIDFTSELDWLCQFWINKDGQRVPIGGLDISMYASDFFGAYIEYSPKHYEAKYGDKKLFEMHARMDALMQKYALSDFDIYLPDLICLRSIEPLKQRLSSISASIEDLEKWASPDYLTNSSIQLNEEQMKENVIENYVTLSNLRPIAICINPHMTERDLLDLVKKSYKSKIEPIQKRYRRIDISINKLRQTSDSKRVKRNFIYENRALSISRLTRLVNDTLHTKHEYKYIDKLRSQEIKKRK